MKLVREHIEFERNIDPLHAMNVGKSNLKRFKSIEDFDKRIIELLPEIFDGKIPYDIIDNSMHSDSGIMPSVYFRKICKYLTDNGYTKSDGSSEWTQGICFGYWVDNLRNNLRKLGY